MIAKELMAGMKVVPISKSVGQNFRDWKIGYFGENRYVIVRNVRVTEEGRVWVCDVPNSFGRIGYFLPKDLIPYQE